MTFAITNPPARAKFRPVVAVQTSGAERIRMTTAKSFACSPLISAAVLIRSIPETALARSVPPGFPMMPPFDARTVWRTRRSRHQLREGIPVLSGGSTGRSSAAILKPRECVSASPFTTNSKPSGSGASCFDQLRHNNSPAAASFLGVTRTAHGACPFDPRPQPQCCGRSTRH